MAEIQNPSIGKTRKPEKSSCRVEEQTCTGERGISKGECIHLTRAQLLKKEQLALIDNTKDFKHSILLSMIKTLTDNGYTEADAGELANQCLSSSVVKIVNTAFAADEKPKQNKHKVLRRCINAGKSFRDTFDSAHLILNAPCEDDEEAVRDQQATNYMQTILGGPLTLARQEKNEDMRVVVRSYQDIKDALRSFFSCMGTRAIRAYIIFNGHGSEEGLYLDDEDEPISIDLFINDIQQVCDTIMQQTPGSINLKGQLPKETTVVLAQCYSHLYEPNTGSDAFRVISLSTPEKPFTQYVIDPDQMSYHEELNAFTGEEKNRKVNEPVIQLDLPNYTLSIDDTQLEDNGSETIHQQVPDQSLMALSLENAQHSVDGMIQNNVTDAIQPQVPDPKRKLPSGSFQGSVSDEPIQCKKQCSLQGQHCKTINASVKRALKCKSLKKLEDEYERYVKEYQNSRISIAVIGKTNSGKSSLINYTRDLTADDPGSAAVGVTPGTTSEIEHYPFPGYDQVRLVNVPGLDCLKHVKNSGDEYLKMINMDNKDVIVICTANDLTDHDAWLAREAQRRKKQYYVVRTHIDATLAGQEDQHPRSFNRQNSLESIRVSLKRQLEEKNLHPLGVYLISNRPRDRARFDLPRFKRDLLQFAPENHKELYIRALNAKSLEVLDEKMKYLKHRHYKILEDICWFKVDVHEEEGEATLAQSPNRYSAVQRTSQIFEKIADDEIKFCQEALGLTDAHMHRNGIDKHRFFIIVQHVRNSVGYVANEARNKGGVKSWLSLYGSSLFLIRWIIPETVEDALKLLRRVMSEALDFYGKIAKEVIKDIGERVSYPDDSLDTN